MNERTPEITLDEIAAAFSQSFAPAIGKLTFRNLELEKQLAASRLELNAAMKAIDDLNQEREKLIDNHISLEAEIDRLIKAGPTVKQMATLEAGAIEARNEKAAPG